MSLRQAMPMLERCLVVAGRRASGHRIRMGVLIATGTLVVFGLLLLPGLSGSVDPRALAAGGGRLLEWVAMVQVAAACVLTPLAMAAALQRDADPTAWDVQQTTPVGAWGLVTGLVLGRLLPVIGLVLCTLPLLLLLRVAGGVPVSAILASTWVAMIVASVAATTAVMLAAMRLGPRVSIISYLTICAATLAVTFAMDAALAQPLDAAGRHSLTVVTPLNPFLVLSAELRPGQIAPTDDWWTGNPLRAFTLVAFAVMVCSWLAAVVLSMQHTPAVRRQHDGERAPRPIGRSPIAWRESRGRPHAFMADLLRWSLAAVMLVGGLVLTAMVTSDSTARLLLKSLLCAAAIGLITTGTILAATAVAREREDRTLDLLLATPLKPGQYLQGKLIGLIRLLWPPAVAVIVVAVSAAVVISGTDLSESDALLPMALIGMAITLPGLLCLCIAIGLAWSVRSRQWTSAAAISMGIVTVVAGGSALLILGVYEDVGPLGVALVGGHPLLGPLAAMSPESWWRGGGDPVDLPTSMLVGGIVGGTCWFVAAWVVIKTTAQSFTMTVRRLAGLD
ncbi:MAG: ABC transporter permease [Phycisphaerales bacterium]|nr:ABC transporter permease [Phycisphaerales bacterium]